MPDPYRLMGQFKFESYQILSGFFYVKIHWISCTKCIVHLYKIIACKNSATQVTQKYLKNFKKLFGKIWETAEKFSDFE